MGRARDKSIAKQVGADAIATAKEWFGGLDKMLNALALALSLSGPTPLKFEAIGASLFKYGFSVVVREAPLPASGEHIVTDLPPSA